MSTLHIINTSPNMRSALQSCLRIIHENDGIIFIEDAVIAAKKNTPAVELIKEKILAKKCFFLKPDLEARGIKEESITQGIKLVDYNGFVKLTTEFDRTQTWN